MKGNLFNLFQTWNGGDLFGPSGGVFTPKMVCLLGAAFDDA